MTRRLLGTLVIISVACIAGHAGAEPSLRPTGVVEGSVIHLGDLFAGAGPHAGDVVAPAPPPGSRTIFDAAWLAATAREHDLAWQPASRFDQATIDRASRMVSMDAISARLLDEIASRQSISGAELQLDAAALRFVVAAESPDAIAVDGLTFDPRTGRFSAFVAIPAGSADAERQRVSGRLIRMTDVPVLNRPISLGETIAAGDIEMVRLRADHLGQDTVADARDLIGKTPRHPLHAHEPLRSADIQVPVIVHKGDLVTIVLQTPTMRLTTQGKAVDDGSMNATIRVANTKSSRVIDATVIGLNAVAVPPTPQFAAR